MLHVMARVDLHFHLLPGVDDGPADMQASMELARAAVADGTGIVVATPHVRTDLGLTDAVEIHARVLELRLALASAGIPLEVRCSGELGHDVIGRLRQSELELLAHGPPECRWLLVETPFHGVGSDFHAATDELRERGFAVLVAHPERSADASLDGAAGLRRELEAGSLAQVNALSLTGGHGEEACRAAWELIAAGLVAVIASDAHGPTRPPALRLARQTLAGVGLSPGSADALTETTPARLLAHGIPSRAAVPA
ncbi:MAG: protein-tyrosine phosphatase [Thermoleophilaceae bacterium]|jgi:protein-tyrosine phosphatase|nr:protein-tyrosine phosphatase [Thermoleophilaceae bacterium]